MKIDLIKGNVEDIALLNALVGHFGDDKFFEEVRPDESVVEVILTVNGKPVPFDLLIRDMASQLQTIHDDEVIKRAIKLLEFSGMGELQERMYNVRCELERTLEFAVQKLKQERE
jgi:hypothetical protein